MIVLAVLKLMITLWLIATLMSIMKTITPIVWGMHQWIKPVSLTELLHILLTILTYILVTNHAWCVQWHLCTVVLGAFSFADVIMCMVAWAHVSNCTRYDHSIIIFVFINVLDSICHRITTITLTTTMISKSKGHD